LRPIHSAICHRKAVSTPAAFSLAVRVLSAAKASAETHAIRTTSVKADKRLSTLVNMATPLNPRIGAQKAFPKARQPAFSAYALVVTYKRPNFNFIAVCNFSCLKMQGAGW
jgi:hypothetical protein